MSAVDTETGIALVFTTSGDVSELRARVAQMAEHQQKMMSQGHMGMMHSGKHSGDHGKEPGAKPEAAAHDHTNSAADQPNSGCTCCAHAEGMHGKRVEHTAQVVEVEGGAKIVYTPKQPADLAALREQLRGKVKMMQEGKCPMMHDKGKAEQHRQGGGGGHEH